ncbi:hypothetical protein [Streptomyces chartreusis]|uniref:hypothetical protein n=1 Tax=Streptomyces chartreusis TaxID=1969 RepID=UPI0036488791
MPYLPLTVSPGPTAPVPLSDPPVVGPTEVVAIVVVLGGIILACIAASLIKTLDGKALDKVKAADVPVVLRIPATWINPFTGFLPSLRGRGTASTRQPASAEGMHHDHVQRQETGDERLNK